MELQELAVKNCWQLPIYTLTHAQQGTHQNTFYYKVKVASVEEMGVGTSKQTAKQEAAQNALKKLTTSNKTILKENSYKPVVINYVAKLMEFCVKNYIASPTFIEIPMESLLHPKEFTCKCEAGSLSTKATAGSKKQAKQLAAKDMFKRLTEVSPSCFIKHNVSTSSVDNTELDSAALVAYKELKKMTKLKFDSSISIENYDRHLINRVLEKGLNLNTVRGYLHKTRDEAALKELLSTLDLDYTIQQLQENPCVVVLCLNTDIPFVVIAPDSSYELSVKKALRKTFEDLDILLNLDGLRYIFCFNWIKLLKYEFNKKSKKNEKYEFDKTGLQHERVYRNRPGVRGGQYGQLPQAPKF
ncbi:hypothetical protein FQA39_LY08151 [Lamprigera yunnana]|nr:hypothetical protein FQA39_LY08151 [Lamprigera yunnana]